MGSDWWMWEQSEREFAKYFNIFYKLFSIIFKNKKVKLFIIDHRFEFIKAAQKIINEQIPDWDVKIKLHGDN